MYFVKNSVIEKIEVLRRSAGRSQDDKLIDTLR